MVRIILIRPGSTDYDEQGRVQGTLDIPLSDHGMVQVKQLAEQLRACGMEAIYASATEPARQTADTLGASLGLKVKRLDQFQNLDHGLWQGLLIDEVRRKYPKVYRQWQEQPESVCPPEGETLSQAEERIRPVIAKLLKRHKECAVGLVVAEPLATLVRAVVKHVAVGDLWKAASEHAPWEVLEVTAEQVFTPSN
jgi:phosphoserine phosphatase